MIGNKNSSGTEILDELAEEEIATGHMIVYTSADSVLQICGNEETFDLEELYRCCEIAREITLKDEWKVGRVIARPYVGKKRGEFKRTSNRKDYALKLPENSFGRIEGEWSVSDCCGCHHDILMEKESHKRIIQTALFMECSRQRILWNIVNLKDYVL